MIVPINGSAATGLFDGDRDPLTVPARDAACPDHRAPQRGHRWPIAAALRLIKPSLAGRRLMARTERTHDLSNIARCAGLRRDRNRHGYPGAAVGKRMCRNATTAAPGRSSSAGWPRPAEPDTTRRRTCSRAASVNGGKRRPRICSEMQRPVALWPSGPRDVGLAHGAGRLDDNANADIAAEALRTQAGKLPLGRQHVLTNDRRGKLRHRL